METNAEVNSQPRDTVQECPECHHSRTILFDSLHSRGRSKSSNAARKAAARDIIAGCRSCQDYFLKLKEKPNVAETQ